MTDIKEQILAAPLGEWITLHSSNVTWQNIRGKNCMVSLASTFATNRGSYIAAAETFDQTLLTVDSADAFPRYYFDLGRAKAEIEAWLMIRDQIPSEGRLIKLSGALFDLVRSYFSDHAITDHRARILAASMSGAWAAPFGDQTLDRYLFEAIKAYMEPRTPYDAATANLFAQLIKAEVE